jgi:hypothetical protein
VHRFVKLVNFCFIFICKLVLNLVVSRFIVVCKHVVHKFDVPYFLVFIASKSCAKLLIYQHTFYCVNAEKVFSSLRVCVRMCVCF